MKRFRIYVDTSVIGGCLDPEFEKPSNRLFDACRGGTLTAVLSSLTRRELAGAPQGVRDVIANLPAAAVEYVEETEEVLNLADAYVSARAVPEGSRPDAIHIACATVHAVDALVSWNFQHIVNLQRIRRYNAVNLANGYPLLEIRSPLELQHAE